MHKILIICGPTATGKTTLAVKLAKKFNGELLSADSRQVYKEMDIGTGKDITNSKFETRNSELATYDSRLIYGYYSVGGIKLWGLDIVSPDYPFNVSDYIDYANVYFNDLYHLSKLPILVGGTGLYIKAVIDGIETAQIPTNHKLREALKEKTASELFDMLLEISPLKAQNMNNSDKNNPRRLIRAIEIAEYLKANPSVVLPTSTTRFSDALFIGLTASKEFLSKKIAQRVEKRFKRGTVKEIESLLAMGYNWSMPSMSGLGYRQWRQYFEKKETEEEVIKKWISAEIDYARRQIVWFKKNKRVNWFDVENSNYEAQIEKFVGSWYTI